MSSALSALRRTPPPASREGGPREGRHFTAAECGPAREWDRYRFSHPAIPNSVPGKLFLRELLGLTGAEISLNSLPAGADVPFLHRHTRNEEIYLFLVGTGEMQVDGERIPLREGTGVRVAPEGVRTWRNTGAAPLLYVVIQVRAGSEPEGETDDGVIVPRKVTW